MKALAGQSKACFEFMETPLQLPLLLCFLVGINEVSAWWGGFLATFRARCAGSRHAREGIRFAPQAGSGQESVFEPCADHLLQVAVAERVGFRGAHIFMRQ